MGVDFKVKSVNLIKSLKKITKYLLEQSSQRLHMANGFGAIISGGVRIERELDLGTVNMANLV